MSKGKTLRQLADDAYRGSSADLTDQLTAMSPEAMQQTLYDLRVHQIELEMQNEELRRSQDELDTSQAHYFDFYDMASVGYCSISESGLIEQANLTAAALFGMDRAMLVRQKIAHFILPDDQDIFYLMRQRIIGTRQSQSCELRLVKQGGTSLWTHLDVLFVPNDGGTFSLKITLTDITERKLAQCALLAANVELTYQNEEKGKRAAELVVANVELAYQNEEKDKRAAELVVANVELTYQNEEKGKRAAELAVANVELAYQNEEKDKRAAELVVANVELAYQNEEKDKRAAELVVANVELTYQNEEKGKRAAELAVANVELTYQNEEKGKRAAELVAQSTLLSTIIENFPGGVSMFDADLLLIGYNRHFRQLLDLPDSFFEKENLHFEDIIRFTAQRGEYGPVDVEQYVADKVKYARKFESYKLERVRPNGVVLEISSNPVVASGFEVIYIDITERKQMEELTRQLAFSDPLTGLPNRRLLMDRLEQAMAAASRHGHQNSLLFLDMDDFKRLNDTLGHDKGDYLLQQIAERMRACVREGDTLARLGGDEFVVLLEDLDKSPLEAAKQAAVVGRTIHDALRQPYKLDSHSFYSSASIGITLFGGAQRESIEEPLKRAELAMYEAKAVGRDNLCFFEPEMRNAINARANLETELHKALEQAQFLLHYQAQVDRDAHLTGVEVLVRWQHPERGLISPAEFIPVAEANGLILPLGHWVLETACKQLAAWAQRPEMAHLTLAVNISARQFRMSNFVADVLAVLGATGAKPERLKLELTESILLDNVNDIITKMTALKSSGVGFSLDDFGTGYSSLAYLKRLPLDQLKIDQGFVRDILIDPNDAAIAKMVVALAETMGLAVIAEGVETEAQRDKLEALGCYAYQGYLFSKPLPIDDFEAFARGA